MERVGTVAVSLTQSHVRHCYSQHTGLDSLWSLDDGAQGCLGGLGPGEAVSVAGIVQNDDGLGAKRGKGGMVCRKFGLEVVAGNRVRRRGRLDVLRGTRS